ncbi:hypothetical protein H7J06_14385 [Mycobacterium hodleri]|uniref:hypothetical protein n=1 Tax=Mycolicibacterium hodleri TaxID=49897 RepID=UPI0021F3AD2B|nr:hypothetical protein [Mycolicibacterium hodleri]MCV7134175.1 hypothetical protein [Mycolicibacterium hodleri]
MVRTKLKERGPALALAVGLIAVPGVPTLVNSWLPETVWETAESADVMTLTSVEGAAVAIAAPDGWQVQNLGDQAILRGDGGAVFVQLYDLDGRDPQAVAKRLMRSNRVDDVHTTLDGGRIATADGSLSGDTCVALTDQATGSCAYLSDDDVMVSVIALGGNRESTPTIADVVAPFTREQS